MLTEQLLNACYIGIKCMIVCLTSSIFVLLQNVDFDKKLSAQLESFKLSGK